MQREIPKLCADSLRTFANEKHGIKVKASHAHELVAAYFGYKSKNAMLADTKYPLSNLEQAEVIVMMPDNFINQRRNDLEGLSSELPDSYMLGEAVYVALFSGDNWTSKYPPFRSFEKLAKFLIDNNDSYQQLFKFYRDIPVHHVVAVSDEEDRVIITVTHSYEDSDRKLIGYGQTTINLPRVAGRIGYGKPKISVEQWTGGARRVLGTLGVRP